MVVVVRMRCAAAAYRAADAAERHADDVVEHALEVVEEDGVGGAFEHECQLHGKLAIAQTYFPAMGDLSDAYPPVRINAAARGHTRHGHDDVHDQKDE